MSSHLSAIFQYFFLIVKLLGIVLHTLTFLLLPEREKIVLRPWIVHVKGDLRDGLGQIPRFRDGEIQKPWEAKYHTCNPSDSAKEEMPHLEKHTLLALGIIFSFLLIL